MGERLSDVELAAIRRRAPHRCVSTIRSSGATYDWRIPNNDAMDLLAHIDALAAENASLRHALDVGERLNAEQATALAESYAENAALRGRVERLEALGLAACDWWGMTFAENVVVPTHRLEQAINTLAQHVEDVYVAKEQP